MQFLLTHISAHSSASDSHIHIHTHTIAFILHRYSFSFLCTPMCLLCISPFWHTQNHWHLHPPFSLSLYFSLSIHLHPASLYPPLSTISFWCMAVYVAFVETASLLEDSTGINLPCLCQATDQQFTGHQQLGLLGGCLTGILGVWHDRAFTAGIVPALNIKIQPVTQMCCSKLCSKV